MIKKEVVRAVLLSVRDDLLRLADNVGNSQEEFDDWCNQAEVYDRMLKILQENDDLLVF